MFSFRLLVSDDYNYPTLAKYLDIYMHVFSKQYIYTYMYLFREIAKARIALTLFK
jgi:hypothetical protein